MKRGDEKVKGKISLTKRMEKILINNGSSGMIKEPFRRWSKMEDK